MFNIIERFILRMTKEDIKNFAISKNIDLSDDELNFTYEFVKKNYKTFLGNQTCYLEFTNINISCIVTNFNKNRPPNFYFFRQTILNLLIIYSCSTFSSSSDIQCGHFVAFMCISV